MAVCVSLESAKFFLLPCGRSLYPFKLDLLKSKVEAIMESLGNMLTEVYADDYKSFFGCTKDKRCTDLTGHSGTHA